MGFNERYLPKTETNSATTKDGPAKPTASKVADSPAPNTHQMKSPLMIIKQLLRVLCTPAYDGRLMLNVEPGAAKASLKYMLLNPKICFEEIVSQSHSVILAGGTMKPVSDFEQLVEDKKRLEYFSCGHVIPRENLVCIGLASGPNGVKFDFSYQSRESTQIVTQ